MIRVLPTFVGSIYCKNGGAAHTVNAYIVLSKGVHTKVRIYTVCNELNIFKSHLKVASLKILAPFP